MSALADIIAQETQDGRLIVRFLISAMVGQLPDFQPCHRIDAARLVIDHAAARRAPNRDSRSQPQAQRPSESQNAAHRVRSELAQIVREETDDGRAAVRFLIDAMQGQFPDFKPCHRLSAAKELLQRGFDYLPDDADTHAAAEPELDPAEIEAQRRAEIIEFSKHGPVYYQNHPYPCVCEDRLHDCKGNLLDEQQREQAARRSPTMEYFISSPEQMDDFLARYAEYLTRWNIENPGNPIDINRIVWTDPNWRHLNNPARAP